MDKTIAILSGWFATGFLLAYVLLSQTSKPKADEMPISEDEQNVLNKRDKNQWKRATESA